MIAVPFIPCKKWKNGYKAEIEYLSIAHDNN